MISGIKRFINRVLDFWYTVSRLLSGNPLTERERAVKEMVSSQNLTSEEARFLNGMCPFYDAFISPIRNEYTWEDFVDCVVGFYRTYKDEPALRDKLAKVIAAMVDRHLGTKSIKEASQGPELFTKEQVSFIDSLVSNEKNALLDFVQEQAFYTIKKSFRDAKEDYLKGALPGEGRRLCYTEAIAESLSPMVFILKSGYLYQGVVEKDPLVYVYTWIFDELHLFKDLEISIVNRVNTLVGRELPVVDTVPLYSSKSGWVEKFFPASAIQEARKGRPDDDCVQVTHTLWCDSSNFSKKNLITLKAARYGYHPVHGF